MPRRVKVDVPSGWVPDFVDHDPVTMPEHQPSVAQKSPPVSRLVQAFASREGEGEPGHRLMSQNRRKHLRSWAMLRDQQSTSVQIKRSEKQLMDLEEERTGPIVFREGEVANRAETIVSGFQRWRFCRPDRSKKSGMQQSGLPRASGKQPCAAHRRQAFF